MATRKSCLIAAAFLLIGCVHKFQVPPPAEVVAIPTGASVYVALVPDGRDDRPRTYEGSGKQATDAIVEALRRRGFQLYFGQAHESLDGSIQTARANRVRYVVYPRIVLWEDRLTEWSGLPDKLALAIRVVDAGTGKTIDSRRVKASSRWLTMGGDHPQDLLPELVSDWADGFM